MAGRTERSGKFDPYHKWLGIPPKLQPANYYRLLGLELFEGDPDAIEAAAERLIQYVRDTARPEHHDHAKLVLKELLTAKNCLLTPDRKQAYDAGLRAGATAIQEPPTTPAPGRVKPIAKVQPKIAKIQSKPTVVARRKWQPLPSLRIVIGSLLGLLAIGVVVIVVRRDPSPRSGQLVSEQATRVTSAESAVQLNSVEEQVATRAEELAPDTAIETNAKETSDASNVGSESVVIESELPKFVAQPEVSGEAGDATTELEITEDTGNHGTSLVEEPATPTPEGPPPTAETTFSVTSAEGTGDLRGAFRDIWLNVTGNRVDEFIEYVLKHPEASERETIGQLETPEDFSDQYGQRLSGYFHPPVTGEYEFLIRANAEAWLFVGTDATRESLRRIEPKTKVQLVADQVYIFEAFHKESTGRDYCSIGWELPDGTEENPIPGERLTTYHRIAPQHESEFVVLAPLTAATTSGTSLQIDDQGRIVADANVKEGDAFEMTFTLPMERVSAIRLEAIPHDSLPAAGPGRGVGGRFAIGEATFALQPAEPSESLRELSFKSIVNEVGRDLMRVADGNPSSTWRVQGRGASASATFVIRNPIATPVRTVLQCELQQRECLGCFRVLATSAPAPGSAASPQLTSNDEDLFALYVNIGGDDFEAPDGVRWQGSRFFDNETFGHEGGKSVSEDLLTNKVQGTALRGITAFRAVVPDGTYNVTLYFCEYWSTSESSRRFAIAAEQTVVAPRFDLLQASGGFATPFVFPIRNLVVDDGRLDIQFQKASEGASAILNAISIKQVRSPGRH